MATLPSSPASSGDTAALYRAAIGPRAQTYYLEHFQQFDREGRAGVSWNWAAYGLTLNWLLFRGMVRRALAYVGAVAGTALLVLGLGKLIANYSSSTATVLALLLLLAAFVMPALYGNAWYYHHCRARMELAQRACGSVGEAAELLARQAPRERRLLGLTVGNVLVLTLAWAVQGLLPWAQDVQWLAGGARVPAVAATPASAAPSLPNAPEPAVVALPPLAPLEQGLAGAEPVSAVAPAAAPAVAELPAESAPSSLPVGTPGQAPPQETLSGWVVQVGAYAQVERANAALAQVQALGLAPGAQAYVLTGPGRLTRVRVGPFEQRAQAAQAAVRIQTLGLPVLVLRQRP